MGFLVGYVLGFVLGFGLIVGFARYQNSRSKRRTELLNWLNHHIDKIWPYVDEAASEIIRNSVEPILEQYRPAILASLKFSKLTLGTVAPQFTGVSILEGDPNEIIVELDLQWDGNPNIVLDIKTRVGVALPIQRNLDFTLKVIGGDISAIPGISDALEDTIRDAVEDSITWPIRKIVPIIPGDYSYLEVKPVGILEVKLIEAKELTNKDIIGKSDPFAKIYIRPLRDLTKTSKTIDNQINPIWNEHFEFEVEDLSTQNVTVKVYDDEGVQAAELIGCAQVPLRNLEPGKVKDVWLKLVHLELLYCPLNSESKFKNPFDPDFRLTSLEKALKQVTEDGVDNPCPDLPKSNSMRSDVITRGVLSVTVVSGEDLPATDFMGKSDPFVVLLMKKAGQKNKTRDKMGRCTMTLTRAIVEGEFTDTFPIDGAKSGKLTLHLKWTSQSIIKE
ncbi:calcium-dependent lipid-binding family protein [Striga asiatica]|uniref:Calcium-dependent lipid-binding family protein n=1 Tax=Striga asiatica TaxID=4170 RepID=A0A5A7R1V6_STRAF|nr:calcium-dependent lipid-binding family protein [Striga asiatica]